MKIVNTIHLGNEYIETKINKHGNRVATLHSGNILNVLEIENAEGKIRIKEFGSANVEPEHFALLLKEADLVEIIIKSLKEIE